MPWTLPALLVWLRLGSAQELPDPPAGPPRFGGYVVPNFAFDTDDGLGFGARGELNRLDPALAPYRSAWVVHLYTSVRGFHHHRFRYDRLGLGPGGQGRLTVHLAWRQWTNDGYWGMGPGVPREEAYLGPFEADDPARKRARYTLVQPFANAALRVRLEGPWQVYGSLNTRFSVVRTYPGSLLEEQQPYGMDGGLTVQVGGGVLYDSRRPEIDPDAGVLWELSARWCPPLPGGAGHFGGPLAQVRVYHTLTPRVVLAGRGLIEHLWGEVPFYEMVHWGGFAPTAGWGGSDAVRGVPFGRYHAPGKALLNTELRVDVVQHTLRDRPMRWLVVPSVDLGWSFGQVGAAPAGPRGSWVVPTAGVGVRAVYDESFVGRIDWGISPDPIQTSAGAVRYGRAVGFYVTFDHLF